MNVPHVSDTLVMLVAQEARGAMPKDGTLQEKAEAAMKSAANHWMVVDPDVQLRGAIGALMLEYPAGTPDGDRVRHEFNAMKRVSSLIGALQAGVPVDLERMAAEPQPEFERIGLVELWRKARP